MRPIIIMGVMIIAAVSFVAAQNMNGIHGRTYYDEAKTKPKEVYVFKEVYSFSSTNPKEMTTSQVKHGAYSHYREEDGTLDYEGFYVEGKKSGEWKYYDKKGNVTKTGKYENGELVK